MQDRTCIKCETVFKYPSILRTHLKNSSRCKIIEDNIIEDNISNISNISNIDSIEIQLETPVILQEPIVITQTQFSCNFCDKVFTRKSSLDRHKKESKCYNNNVTNNITNNDNRVINNNIIINNINLPQIIYPFGKEDISFLNDSEMLDILKSPNGAIIAMEKVYSKIENRNFYKQNIGKDNISYLDSNLDIKIYKQKDFHDKLLYQSVEFMYRICFKCRDRLTL